MSLVRKMQEGAKTPTLYTMYGKQYDFDELQRMADQGLSDHLSQLKRGKKDEAEFRNAYNNIMIGIRDGSITYQDGKFVDTKYGYHNSSDKDKNKDHYGLMANYIFGKMGKTGEYVKPEDKSKIKWNGSASIGTALKKYLYNSDSENIEDFIDIDRDSYDETTKKRGTTKRAQYLSDKYNKVLSNFDSLFTGYTDADKADAEAYIKDAIKYLEDGSIDAGDYLALSKAASGLDYKGMFSNELNRVPSQPQQESPSVGGNQSFFSWLREHYPQFVGTLRPSRNITTSRRYDPQTLSKLSGAIQNLSDSDLYGMLRAYISNPDVDFNRFQFMRNTFGDQNWQFQSGLIAASILNTLKSKKQLKSFGEDNLNMYYIPNTDDSTRQTAWIWNDQTGEISEASYHDIPYWREKIEQEWLDSNGGSEDNSYYSSRYRGRVVKAQSGAVMNRNSGRGPTATASGGPNNWLAVENTSANASDTDKWGNYYRISDILAHIKQSADAYNAAGSTEVWTPWGSGGYNRGADNKIITGGDGKTKFGLTAQELTSKLNDLEQLGSNLSWSKTLNAKGFHAWNQKFDETGLNHYFGGNSDKFDYMGPSTYNRYGLLQQMKTGYTQDNPLVIGSDSIYWGDNKWNILPTKSSVEEQVKPQVDSQIQPQITNPVSTEGEDSTSINFVTGDRAGSGLNGKGFLNVMKSITPDLIGAGRLAMSLSTNNRVAKTIRPSLTPVLKNTYERFSPITGDLYARQSGYRRAGEIQSRFSKPLTSDASLHTNTMLDANRQATALRSQADAADNQEIKRTSAEALARVEDNMARRSEVANFNRASMNQTNREIAQLEATRLKSNWQSWDNYLQGIEGRLRTKYDTEKDKRDNFRLAVASNDAETRFQERIKDATAQVEAWRASHPGVSVTTMPGYRQYEELIREATRWKNAETYAAHADIYGYDYINPYKDKSWIDTASLFSFKNGGQLRPSALNLINKVIRNENNT